MAVDFLFENPTKVIPAIKKLEELWGNIPDKDIQRQICYEHQYLDFHVWFLQNIRSTKTDCASKPPYKKELGLSVRAGAVKAAVLICASIAEAALRAHAERRGYPLPSDPKQRMFGMVLKSWKDGPRPRDDIKHIWDKITELQDARNNVHLHKAAKDTKAYFTGVLEREQKTLSNAKEVLKHLQMLQSS
jgi:hypothetical protein